MGEKIEFTINIEPMASGKPAITRRGFVYTPPKKRAFKDQITLLSKKYRPLKPWEGPISLYVTFRFTMPKYKQKNPIKIPMWHIVKPDTDNLIKGVKDCLTKGGFWTDDCQVCMETVIKGYAYPGDEPDIIISIERL